MKLEDLKKSAAGAHYAFDSKTVLTLIERVEKLSEALASVTEEPNKECTTCMYEALEAKKTLSKYGKDIEL